MYMCNKNVDIKFSNHETFLELPSSGTLIVLRLESLVIEGIYVSKYTK